MATTIIRLSTYQVIKIYLVTFLSSISINKIQYTFWNNALFLFQPGQKKINQTSFNEPNIFIYIKYTSAVPTWMWLSLLWLTCQWITPKSGPLMGYLIYYKNSGETKILLLTKNNLLTSIFHTNNYQNIHGSIISSGGMIHCWTIFVMNIWVPKKNLSSIKVSLRKERRVL